MGKKVLNFGSLNYDYVYQVDHIMRPGETQTSKGMETFCGGKGLNQSVALAKAGCQVYHAGAVGEEGQELLSCLKDNGVDTSFVRRLDGKSGHTIIQVDRDAQNCIMLYAGANRRQERAHVDSVLEQFGEGDYLLLQNEINELAYIIDRAYERGMKVVLNPSPFDAYLKECDMSKVAVFMMNEIEGREITGEEDPEKILKAMAKLYPYSEVVLTLGGDGAVYSDYQRTVSQPIYPVKAVDTTAAGDTFTGYFIAGLLEGLPMGENLDRCARASSITVSRRGAAPSIPLLAEL